MAFSKNRIKTLLKKNRLQSRKKIKKNKKKIKKKLKSNSFRKKKINIRQKSIKLIKHNKAKQRIANRAGGNKHAQTQTRQNTDLSKFINKKENTSEILDEEENKYYNFSFLIIKDEQKQEIINPVEEEKKWDEIAMTQQDKEEKDEMQKFKETDKEIHGPTREFIEDGKKVCKSRIYMVNTGTSSPVILTEECDPEVSTQEWFEQIFNSI